MKNSSLSVSDLIEAVCRPTCSVSGKHILCISDSSSANYHAHNGRLKCNDPDVGVIEDDKSTGFYFHNSLGIDAQTGLPLGFGHIKFWTHSFERTKKLNASHKKLPIEEKESYRWLEGVAGCQQVFKEAATITAIHDRESDIYELFARIPSERTHLLVRSSWNRLLESGELLASHLDNCEVLGCIALPLLPEVVG